MSLKSPFKAQEQGSAAQIAYVDAFVLANRFLEAKDEQELEILRLAALGLKCEAHGEAIKDALSAKCEALSCAKISRFERARDALFVGAVGSVKKQ